MSNRPEHHYVPVLKGKKGEFDALRQVDRALRTRITPLVEITTLPWDWDNDAPTKTLEAHLESAVRQLASGWGADHALWLDTLWLDPGDQAGGTSPLEYLFDLTRGELVAVPVGGPGRPSAHTGSVAAVHRRDQRGAVLRLDPEDLGDPGALTSSIDAWLATVGVTPSDVDLVLDFNEVTPSLAATVTLTSSLLVPTLPYLSDWRSFTLASGGFPVDLAAVEAESVQRLPRCDYAIWQTVVSRTLPRLPAFGDYAINHPSLSDIDPRTMRPSATIRYAGDGAWVIVKGRWAVRYGFDQFNAGSGTLISLPDWEGQGHCDGCQFIHACAAGGSPGNLTVWRRVGTVHHLTHTAAQLANLP
jgi:hypothetical protein